MENWLKELLNGHLRLFEDFCKKREKKYLLADVIDVILAFLRNGIAYGYLITLTLQGELSASQFLLLFTAVGGFTEWVRGILSSFSTLHKQCLDISPIREYLDQEEIFRMEGGESINHKETSSFDIELKNVTFLFNVSQTETGDRQRAWECLEKARIADKIRSLPQGLDTYMDKSVYNDAAELSGGEMQRLMLARLLYRGIRRTGAEDCHSK